MTKSPRINDSRCALFTGALVLEIAERGWDREWPETPHQSRGRLPGSTNGSWPEKITLRVPVDLVQTVHAAIWHTHKEEIGKLRDWRDQHPRPRPTRASRAGCDAAALEEYQRLAATITTPGDLWRAAVARGLNLVRTAGHQP
ncbi:hypothetical protein AB5J72_50380 [Streptomyces sp. CG1]|uniref:hypothetical protein n=1 Tax=Streptomyces sp. CG1 TaxID=1287523 RepID=UPI0034E2A1C9